MDTPPAVPALITRWDHYIDLLRAGNLPHKAARLAGLTMPAVYDRRRKNPAFVQDEMDAIAEYAEVLEQVIIDAALAKPPTYDDEAKVWIIHGPSKDAVNAAEKWLKARARYIWSPDPKMTVEHKHQVELTTSDDLKALAARLEERRARAVQGYTPAALTPGGEDIEDAELVDDDD